MVYSIISCIYMLRYVLAFYFLLFQIMYVVDKTQYLHYTHSMLVYLTLNNENDISSPLIYVICFWLLNTEILSFSIFVLLFCQSHLLFNILIIEDGLNMICFVFTCYFEQFNLLNSLNFAEYVSNKWFKNHRVLGVC